MKKVLSLFLSIVMLFSITAGLDLTASADISGDFEYTILDDGTAELTDYTGSTTDLIIPSTLDAYTVSSIGNYAFAYCKYLTNVTIPNSATKIGSNTFSHCENLLSVTIPDSVTSIGSNAFNHCTNLNSVIVPNNVTNIGDYAFFDCTGLLNVTIGSSVENIGYRAFYNCINLISIGVIENNQSFSSQDGVLFDKNKTVLIQYPTGNKKSLYIIPSSVLNIYDFAFCFCSNITSVTIPNSVTCIGNGSFAYCSGLMNVTIPDNVESIGREAFFHCTNITNITLSDSIKNIGMNVFYKCENLTNITIPNSITVIVDGAFYDCSSLSDVYYTGTKEQWNSITIGSDNECLTNATIHYALHEHTYADVVTQPSCTAGGFTTHTCTICGESYVDSYTNPTGHNFNGGKNCVVCGAVNPNYVEPTPTPTSTPVQPTTTASAQTTTKPATAVKKPKSTSISKLTKGKKQFKVTWKKVSGVAGYQIQYSTDKKFKKNNKTVTAKKSSTSATVKKLKSKKTYYVRVRTYKTTKVNGKTTKVYSSWSKVKSVKTK